MTVTARFKSGAFGRTVTWEIEGDTLLKNGQAKVDLAQVTGGHVGYSTYRGIHRTVKVESPTGAAVIRCSSLIENHHQAEMARFSSRVLERVAKQSPGTMIHMGGSRREHIGSFVLGLMFIAAAPFFLSAPWNLVQSEATVIGLVTFAVGVAIAWLYRPGSTRFAAVPARSAMRSMQGAAGSRAERRRRERKSRR